jgi:hypothetical protein
MAARIVGPGLRRPSGLGHGGNAGVIAGHHFKKPVNGLPAHFNSNNRRTVEPERQQCFTASCHISAKAILSPHLADEDLRIGATEPKARAGGEEKSDVKATVALQCNSCDRGNDDDDGCKCRWLEG